MFLHSSSGDPAFDPNFDPEKLSNKELVRRCSQLGRIAVKSRRMFVGLLPLVERRCAYDVKKFSSVHHFAAVVGGVDRHIVDAVLRLDTQLSTLPSLRRAMYSGEIGWSKIRAVMSFVTVDNEKQWLDLLRRLPRAALIVYVRDFRRQELEENIKLLPDHTFAGESVIFLSEQEKSQENQIALIDAVNLNKENSETPPEFPSKSEPPTKFQRLSQRQENFSFPINSLVAVRLRLFRKKLEKKLKRQITWEMVMVELLKNIIDK